MFNDWLWTRFPETALEAFQVRHCLYYGTCTLASVVIDHWVAALLVLALLSGFMLISALIVTGLFAVVVVWALLIAFALLGAIRTILFEMWDTAKDLAAWVRRVVYRI